MKMEIVKENIQITQVSLSELLEVIEKIVQKCLKENKSQLVTTECSDFPLLVTGVKRVAALLGISVSTVSRMKSEGLLDDAIFQNGNTVIFDIHKVLEILRISNQKGKYNRNII